MAEEDIPHLAEFLSFDKMKKNPAANKHQMVEVTNN
jgi:hypothetical protein